MSMRNATWFSLPMSCSSWVSDTNLIDSNSSISHAHALYLKSGRDIQSVLVLISHPRNIFVSDGDPSAWNFLSEMMSFLGI